MESEQMQQRIAALEHEVKTLKRDIQKTLVEIQHALPEKTAASARWQKKAWLLAIVNMLLAIVLFSNIYLYLPGGLFLEDATLALFLRAFWLALAFVWLLLQMYPLVLLLEQEDPEWQNIAWRNALSFVRNRPDMLIGLTVVVLIVAVVNSLLPSAWLIVALILLVLAGSAGVRYVLERKHKARKLFCNESERARR
ncbi:MAG: hypothetical protein HY868_11305 [Chloroflexi bacterium]|nr:hypothetical protein [Chloroflexota bacterium]